MLVMFGMPKIMENSESLGTPCTCEALSLTYYVTVDPEMREEFDKQQRTNTIANTLTGSGGGGFDAASWLAGGSKTHVATGPSIHRKITDSEAKGGGSGGKPRRRG